MPKGQHLHLVSHQRRVIIPIPRTHFVSSEVGTRFCVSMRPPVVFAFPPAQPALLASDVFYFLWVWYVTRDWTRSF